MCAQPECASTQNSPQPRRVVFFNPAQARAASGKNALAYDECASGRLYYYIHADHIDTPRVVVDRSDNLRWRWMAEPFGTTAPENNPSGLGTFTQNLRFPGQYFDQESGLQDNWHRSYDSTLGRYTTFDPIGLAGGINGFAYVGGNPLSGVDPNGLRLVCIVPLGCHYEPDPPPFNPDYPSTPAPNYTPIPEFRRPDLGALCRVAPLMCAAIVVNQICKVDEKDKEICDKNHQADEDKCYEQFGNGLRGPGFSSNLKGCLAWAERRRNACYRGEPDPGRYRGGDSWSGGGNR